MLTVFCACGTPDSDAVFTGGAAKAAQPDSAQAVAVQPSAPRIQTRSYGGYYQRVGDDPMFQPCGTTRPLAIYGAAPARQALKERFRWNITWEGTKMFGQFQGAIVTDTARVSDSTGVSKRTPRTRFFIVDVESLRTWKPTDCGGMRIP
jgi:hypothetical protein